MRKDGITVANIRQDEWVNPFGASPEELLAGAMDESGLLDSDTTINGKRAQEVFQSFSRKRNLFQEATRLGSILLKEGLITKEQLNMVLQLQAGTGKPLGELLIERSICDVNDIHMALERQKSIRDDIYRLELARETRRGLWNRIVRFFFESGRGER